MATPVTAQEANSPAPDAAPVTSSTVSSSSTATTEPSPASSSPDVGYKKGFFIQSSDGLYKLKINGRVQARYELELPDGGGHDSEFSIPRARVKMGGHAFTKALGYKLQLDFGKGFAGLKDFYVDYALASNWLSVRAGQFKKPFSRHQLTSSGKQPLVDRAITDKAFGAGRDIGLMFHNGFGKKNALEFAVGVFNGTGDKGTFSGDVEGTADADGNVTGSASGKFSNLPGLFNPALVMRVGYNFGELKGYSGGDFEGGGFRLGLGANAMLNFDAEAGDNGRIDVGFDAIMKAGGFALATELFMRTEQDGEAFGDQSLSKMGLYAQASFVLGDHFLPIVRYERVMPEGDNNDAQVITGGFGVFFFGHNLKLQTELSLLDEETDTGDISRDLRVRTQLQLAF